MNNLQHLELIIILIDSAAKVERSISLVDNFVAHKINKIRHFWSALFLAIIFRQNKNRLPVVRYWQYHARFSFDLCRLLRGTIFEVGLCLFDNGFYRARFSGKWHFSEKRKLSEKYQISEFSLNPVPWRENKIIKRYILNTLKISF